MLINTNNMVGMKEANQNFSKVVHIVDENGMAVIMKNNKPRYVIVGFEEYDDISEMRDSRKKKISEMADKLINENLEAFKELAK